MSQSRPARTPYRRSLGRRDGGRAGRPGYPARAPEGTRGDSRQPVRSLLEAGIPVAFRSDWPPNPYLNLMLAITHPHQHSEGISREQAVVAYTRTGAYAEFAPTMPGSSDRPRRYPTSSRGRRPRECAHHIPNAARRKASLFESISVRAAESSSW